MIGRAFAAGRPAAPLPRRGTDAGAARLDRDEYDGSKLAHSGLPVTTAEQTSPRVYSLRGLRARIVARASVTGWLSRVVSLPARVLGSRATPSWINRVRRSK